LDQLLTTKAENITRNLGPTSYIFELGNSVLKNENICTRKNLYKKNKKSVPGKNSELQKFVPGKTEFVPGKSLVWKKLVPGKSLEQISSVRFSFFREGVFSFLKRNRRLRAPAAPRARGPKKSLTALGDINRRLRARVSYTAP
jgi:hypothetical protein